jgi:hypothetical protein
MRLLGDVFNSSDAKDPAPSAACADRRRTCRGGQSRGNCIYRPHEHFAKSLNSNVGRVAEWFKAPVLKTGVPARVPWVRIPPLPPLTNWFCYILWICIKQRAIERMDQLNV